MDGSYNWYVLYTRANAEQRVIRDMKQAFLKRGTEYSLDPFCPESEFYYRTSKAKKLGKVYKKRPLFPGYVFLETDMPEKDFLKQFSGYIYESPDIIRILRNGSSGSIAIDAEERIRFEYLFKGRRCLDHSVGYIEGDKVTVTSGPLMGLEGSITHIYRHDQIATVKIDLFGRSLEAKLALEIVSKA